MKKIKQDYNIKGNAGGQGEENYFHQNSFREASLRKLRLV